MIKAAWNFIKKHQNWIVFVIVVIFVVKQRSPSFMANSSIEGLKLEPVSLVDVKGHSQSFPPKDSAPVVALVWNTWCVPCKVEASVTPTLYLIDSDGVVKWASSGVGLTEIWRMERHLK